jgi:hypothetical protein
MNLDKWYQQPKKQNRNQKGYDRDLSSVISADQYY